MKLRDWVLFILLGAIWGSSFLWIKIALEEIGPFALVALRLLFGVLGLLVAVLLWRPSLPSRRWLWVGLGMLGVTNTALPFVLISWGEQHIDSSVASILNGAVPLFTLVIAHLFLRDERITLRKAIGLLTGFGGVVLLVGRDVGYGAGRDAVLGQLAVLVAAISYASSSVFARRNLHEVSPILQAFASLAVADTVVWLAVPVFESPFGLPALPLTWLALVWLGLLGTCVAYILYFYLLQSIGATRATMVTYVIPVVGVVLGVIFLHERLDWFLGGGAALVIAGIGIVNTRKRQPVTPQEQPASPVK